MAIRPVTLILFGFLAVTLGLAQPTIVGTVTDPSGAAVAGATVRLTNGLGYSATTSTDDAGA